METVIGSLLIALAAMFAAIKMWMVHHAARLTDQDRGVGLSSGVVFPTLLLVVGLYCIDASNRRLWFGWEGYLGLAAAVATLFLLLLLALRAYGHRLRTGRWSRHRR